MVRLFLLLFPKESFLEIYLGIDYDIKVVFCDKGYRSEG